MVSLPTFNNTGVTATLEQEGAADVSSGVVWANSDTPLWSKVSNSQPGFTFDFNVSVDSERSLALAPTIPYTIFTGDLAGTGEVDLPWTLTFVSNHQAAIGFRLFVMAEAAPALFSSTHFADVTNDPAPYLYATYTSSSSVWGIPKFGGNITLTIPLDFDATLAPQEHDGSDTKNAITRIVRDPNWNGRLQVFMIADDSGAGTISSATFVGPVVPFHTGQIGLDLNRRARVVHDYIGGFPYLSDEAVADPWRDGVMVHPDSSDPDEMRKRHPFVPPMSEGVVDDDIPKVE